jgi:hypothetical protein
MSNHFRKGDKFNWKSHGSTVAGTVEEEITSDTESAGRAGRAEASCLACSADQLQRGCKAVNANRLSGHPDRSPPCAAEHQPRAFGDDGLGDRIVRSACGLRPQHDSGRPRGSTDGVDKGDSRDVGTQHQRTVAPFAERRAQRLEREGV